VVCLEINDALGLAGDFPLQPRAIARRGRDDFIAEAPDRNLKQSSKFMSGLAAQDFRAKIRPRPCHDMTRPGRNDDLFIDDGAADCETFGSAVGFLGQTRIA
jgi:hypothetical protein